MCGVQAFCMNDVNRAPSSVRVLATQLLAFLLPRRLRRQRGVGGVGAGRPSTIRYRGISCSSRGFLSAEGFSGITNTLRPTSGTATFH